MRDDPTIGNDPAQDDRDTANSVRQRLDAVGLRVTKPRVAVFRCPWRHSHSTADEVVNAVRADTGAVSTQAVYDVLNACTNAGLLRRIEPARHPARFESRVGDNHHHLVCRVCGRTSDVDCVMGTAPCLTPSSVDGYRVEEAEIVSGAFALIAGPRTTVTTRRRKDREFGTAHDNQRRDTRRQ
jgi:Fur family ferric uptake transcriptional regulator